VEVNHQDAEDAKTIGVDRGLRVREPIFPAKVIHYLKVSKLELGLITNFHIVLLKDGIKRIVLT